MNRPFNEELISAYLDGELTAEEQALVEQVLAADARLRRLHDDMRALRGRLQALPQQKLDADFAQRVLRAAERAQAEQSAPVAAVARHEPDVLVKSHHGQQTTVAPAQHEPMAWRVAVWTIAGLAAALLLMLFMAEPTSQLAEKPVGLEEDKVATTEQDAASSPDEAATQEEDLAKAMKGARPLDRSRGAAAGLEQQGESAGAAAPQDTEETRPAPAIIDDAAPARDEASGLGGGGKALMREAPKRAFAAGNAFRKEGDAGRLRELESAGEEEVVVVRLKVSREQLEKRVIDDVLARHSISLEKKADPRAFADALEKADKQRFADRNEVQGTPKPEQAERERVTLQEQAAEFAKKSKDVDVLYVEATLAQVEAAVADLTAQPGAELMFGTSDDQPRSSAARDALAPPPPGPAAPKAAEADQVQDEPRSAAAPGLSALERLDEARPKAAAPPAESGRGEGRSERVRPSFAQRLTAPKEAAAPRESATTEARAAPLSRTRTNDAPGATQEGSLESKSFDRRLDKEPADKPPADARRKAASGDQRVRVLFVIEAQE